MDICVQCTVVRVDGVGVQALVGAIFSALDAIHTCSRAPLGQYIPGTFPWGLNSRSVKLITRSCCHGHKYVGMYTDSPIRHNRILLNYFNTRTSLPLFCLVFT
jgi:hypothetical protein